MPTSTSIDLNVDAGESFGTWTKGNDEELFQFVSSVNVACGFHAGDPFTMLNTVRHAEAAGVTIGAHPSYRDLIGFGRRALQVAAEEIYSETLYQVGALGGVLRSIGLKVHHVSPHGALGWATWNSREVAEAVSQAVKDFDSELPILALGNTEIEGVALSMGIPVIRSGFPERGYLDSGQLAPRGMIGAVITDPQEAADRAASMIIEGQIRSVSGTLIELEVESLLIHGDNPSAPSIARAVRQVLLEAGVSIRSF